jgi:hypothetical protein
MNNEDKLKFMELEWKKFAKKYIKNVDCMAQFSDLIRPIEQEAVVGRMVTQIMAAFVVSDGSIEFISSKAKMKVYSRIKKLGFLIGIQDFLEDRLEKIKQLQLKYIDK